MDMKECSPRAEAVSSKHPQQFQLGFGSLRDYFTVSPETTKVLVNTPFKIAFEANPVASGTRTHGVGTKIPQKGTPMHSFLIALVFVFMLGLPCVVALRSNSSEDEETNDSAPASS
jgi:hypothetical protein